MRYILPYDSFYRLLYASQFPLPTDVVDVQIETVIGSQIVFIDTIQFDISLAVTFTITQESQYPLFCCSEVRHTLFRKKNQKRDGND